MCPVLSLDIVCLFLALFVLTLYQKAPLAFGSGGHVYDVAIRLMTDTSSK